MPELQIPPVPEGIVNPENLYNDVYGERQRLRWSDRDFHARLAWINSQVPHRITAWHAPLNHSPISNTPLRTSTMFRAQVSDELGLDVDVLLVATRPDLVVAMLKSLTLGPGDVIPQGQPYPGIDALFPAGENPIGELWEPAPLPNREVYREKPTATPYATGDRYETVTKTYQRIIVSFPGTGPFGTGGKQTPAWEVVYRR